MKLFYLLIIIFIIVCIYFIYKYKNDNRENFKLNTTFSLIPVSKKEGQELVSESDDYTQNFSKFDIQSKTRNIHSTSEQEYLNYAKKQVLEWTSQEKKKLNQVFTNILNKLNKLNIQLNMPTKIKIIKSTMKEEGNATGYTRRNFIVINNIYERLLAHELFHVFSRNNPTIRNKIYQSLDFSEYLNKIIYPPKIKNYIISNPDTPQIVTTQIIHKNKKINVVPVLHSSKKYSGGSFFDNMIVSLLLPNENLVISMNDSKEYQQKFGKNTFYTIHPEEVSADHFSYLITKTNHELQQLPNPKLITNLKKILQQ